MRLEPLLMELLVFLCERAGEVVPKQAILDGVWGGRFVSDETVKGSFYQLRKALGDDPRQPRFIETLPKRGYRVLSRPQPLEPASPSLTPADALYEKGRAAMAGQPSIASLQQARLYFERGIEANPSHAAAHAALAHAYLLALTLGFGRGCDLLPPARASATRACELDPQLAEACTMLAMVRFLHDRDFPAAEREFRTALELDPSDATAHRWFARFLSSQVRHAEAIVEARCAVQADPLSLLAHRDLLEVLATAGRYDEALVEARALFDLSQHAPAIHLGMVWFYHLRGDAQGALTSFLTGLEQMGVAPAMLEQSRGIFERGGMPAIFRMWMQMLEHEAALGQKNQIDMLVLTALLGECDRCFALLDVACNEGNPFVLWVPVSPLFDSLRSDPRYPAFVVRLSQPFPNREPTSSLT
jgi:DNA-binding winged helix-turn-helix (wHTH) protein/Flp pilus assembly protein TadD